MAGGRPTDYKKEYAKTAAAMCKLGATDANLAEAFGVSLSTLSLWKVTHKEFSDSVKLAKEEADARVEASLFQRAMGYEHDEVDIKVIDKEVILTPIRKYYPPDSTAMIFWLKNRQPAKWREKQEIEHSGKITRDLTDEELDARIAALMKDEGAK
jgi:hypothetical protein